MRLSDQTHPLALGGKVVVPVGSFEQHGPHLPLSTDSLIAKAVAEKVAKKISAVVGPSIKIGVSPEHMGFSGTITYTSKTFKAVVTEVVESLKKHGYSQVIIINGHGGNNKSLSEIDLGTTVVNLTTLIKPYDHAGEIETSIMLFAHPDLVRKGKIKKHEYTLHALPAGMTPENTA